MAKVMWLYQQDGEEQGPISSADIRRMAARGTLAPDDLVRRESMSEWVAAHRLRGVEFKGGTTAPAASSQTKTKTKTATPSANTAEAGEYAGIVRRWIAFSIDTVIGSLLMFAGCVGGSFLSMMLFAEEMSSINWAEKEPTVLQEEIMLNFDALLIPILITLTLPLLVLFLYHLIFVCTKAQGTLGKIICKIKIVRTDGEKMSFLQVVWRLLVKGLGTFGILGGLGALTALFTKKKQSLHDLLAGTIVVRK